MNENLLSQADCVVVTTAHSAYNYEWIVENTEIVVDRRNATKYRRKIESLKYNVLEMNTF